VEFQVADFSAKGVVAKSEASHTANDISRKHVPGKLIVRMGSQSSLCSQCAPLVINQRFAVALSRVVIRKRCPKL